MCMLLDDLILVMQLLSWQSIRNIQLESITLPFKESPSIFAIPSIKEFTTGGTSPYQLSQLATFLQTGCFGI